LLLSAWQAVSEAGIEHDEAHVPLLLHAAYGEWPVRLIVLLRNPIERLWSAFHEYGQYKGKYGATPEVAAYTPDSYMLSFVRLAPSSQPLHSSQWAVILTVTASRALQRL
jgi:hypothetical protein